MILYNRIKERIYLDLTNTDRKKENFLLYKLRTLCKNHPTLENCANETCFETCQWRRLP